MTENRRSPLRERPFDEFRTGFSAMDTLRIYIPIEAEAAPTSRTYLSTLERGQKSPTLDKIDVISQTIGGIHLLSLLALTYLYSGEEEDIDSILSKIKLEINSIHREQAIQN